MANIVLREWIERFNLGEFNSKERSVQCEAGWYDWFCKDKTLGNKTQYLGKKLITLLPTEMFDLDNTYVFFKNNCPMEGSLYDSFSICDIETGNVLFWITPGNGHKSYHYKKPIVADFVHFTENQELLFPNWVSVKKYFHSGILPETVEVFNHVMI